MNITFKPEITTLGYFAPREQFTLEQLRDEKMFFTYEPFLAYHEAGPITRGILDEIIALGVIRDSKKINGLHWVLDTRVTMTMIGQYPSIPGWHCDDVPRAQAPSTQPNFDLCSTDVAHYMCLVSNGYDETNPCVSGTEFITNERIYDINKDRVWQSLHEAAQVDETKKIRRINEREIIKFNQLAIHRATPTTRPGWRMFFRLSQTYRKPVNSIRNQVQIYVDPNNAGW